MKAQILSILQAHQGQANAVTARELADLLGAKDARKVRRVIHDLRLEGVPIASSPTGKPGYFIPTDRDEAEHCLAILWHQVKELSAIARPLSQAFRLHFPEVPVQMNWLEAA